MFEWGEIANGYKDTLVLGNGASIALHPDFKYRSLLDHAQRAGKISDDVRAVFDHLKTTDFELVLRMLWHARHVNSALHIEDERTARAYAALREALIESVRSLHVGYETVKPYFDSITKYLEPFDTVFSLNYDLILYWAILRANNEHRGLSRFKDCWVGREFAAEWERMRRPLGTDRCTLVFYPHGSLMLATTPSGGEAKLTNKPGPGGYLTSIFADWRLNNWIPLFVSEGESSQKLAAIARSPYLSTVYNEVLAKPRRTVAIYGWSLPESDDHILRRICSPSTERIAISIHRGERSAVEVEKICRARELRVYSHNPHIEVQFYDADSDGCWLRAPTWEEEPAQP